jgi:hypothetical protein
MRYSALGFLHKSDQYGLVTSELGQKIQKVYGFGLKIAFRIFKRRFFLTKPFLLWLIFSAEIKTRIVATFALAVIRFNHFSRSHLQG